MNTDRVQSFRWDHIIIVIIIAVALLFFFSFVAPQFKTTELNLAINEFELNVKTTHLTNEELDLSEASQSLYVDTINRFTFNVPNANTWKAPEKFQDLSSLFAQKNLVQSDTDIKFYPQPLIRSPLGKMIQEQHGVRISSKEEIRVEFGDSAKHELLDLELEGLKSLMQTDSMFIDSSTLAQIRQQLIGFKSIDFSNEFVVHVYNKSKLKGFPVRVSLAKIFLKMIESLTFTIDRIKANDNVIFASASGDIENATIDGSMKDFYAYRWMLFLESSDRYYLVEIGFSPQAKNSIRAWEDLKEMFESFRIIT